MEQTSFKRLRFAAVSINLFGLVLSVGTWIFRIWLRTRAMSCPHPIGFTWTLGVFCWLLGLIMFIAAWIAESKLRY
jgi:predicted PurR-regulated permease PerM